jgi:hypothetical protein
MLLRWLLRRLFLDRGGNARELLNPRARELSNPPKANKGSPVEHMFVSGGGPGGMISMEQWEVIRLRCERDGEPIKHVARDLALSPNIVRKNIRKPDAPEPQRHRRPSKLERFVDAIDALIRPTPKITAKRIGAIICRDHDSALSISPSALRKFVAVRRHELVPLFWSSRPLLTVNLRFRESRAVHFGVQYSQDLLGSFSWPSYALFGLPLRPRTDLKPTTNRGPSVCWLKIISC